VLADTSEGQTAQLCCRRIAMDFSTFWIGPMESCSYGKPFVSKLTWAKEREPTGGPDGITLRSRPNRAPGSHGARRHELVVGRGLRPS